MKGNTTSLSNSKNRNSGMTPHVFIHFWRLLTKTENNKNDKKNIFSNQTFLILVMVPGGIYNFMRLLLKVETNRHVINL